MYDICRMNQILVLGAGKSATALINYLLANAKEENWKLILADANLHLALEKINNSPFGSAVSFDITDDSKRRYHISNSDIVISMLPPALHIKVAKDCLAFSKHLLTASYVDDEMKSMEAEIDRQQVLFLCEMGLDPGIDHMSAMKLIDYINSKGGKIISFKSHCGGLVAQESDDNPWQYKISWNPRNIVLAGKAGAVFKKNNEIFNVPYDSVFENNDTVSIPGLGNLAYYPNRDSLSYIPVYGLEETSTFIRTTLRHPAFCKAWDCIVKGYLTDEDKSAAAVAAKHISYREWVDKSISIHTDTKNFEEFLDQYVNARDKELVKNMFAWLGLLGKEGIPLTATCSADVLQFVFENKLSLMPHDKDMIVMLHEFEYMINGQPANISSSLIVK